jgi:hypothetical protein
MMGVSMLPKIDNDVLSYITKSVGLPPSTFDKRDFLIKELNTRSMVGENKVGQVVLQNPRINYDYQSRNIFPNIQGISNNVIKSLIKIELDTSGFSGSSRKVGNLVKNLRISWNEILLAGKTILDLASDRRTEFFILAILINVLLALYSLSGIDFKEEITILAYVMYQNRDSNFCIDEDGLFNRYCNQLKEVGKQPVPVEIYEQYLSFLFHLNAIERCPFDEEKFRFAEKIRIKE